MKNDAITKKKNKTPQKNFLLRNRKRKKPPHENYPFSTSVLGFVRDRVHVEGWLSLDIVPRDSVRKD